MIHRAVEDTFGHMNEVLSVDNSFDMSDIAKAITLKGKIRDTLPAGRNFRLYLPRENEVRFLFMYLLLLKKKVLDDTIWLFLYVVRYIFRIICCSLRSIH